MEPIEMELKNALARTDSIPAAELAALNGRIIQTFARRQRAVHRVMWIYLALLAASELGLVALFMSTSDLKLCLLYGIAMLIAIEGTVLIKLWYWIVHSRIATVREIKLLQLAIAETKGRPASTPPPAVPLAPEEGAPVTRSVASAWSKQWQAIVAGVWLLAAASLVYSIWWQLNPWPRNMYFEKAITVGEASGTNDWAENFEVTKPRQHFWAGVQVQDNGARVWLTCSAEGHEPMFTGWVTGRIGSKDVTESHFGFGIPTLGRYTIKAKAEGAVHGYTVRVGGVDEFPGTWSMRIFLLMVSAAVVVFIPLVWLQNRGLRWADPELSSQRE